MKRGFYLIALFGIVLTAMVWLLSVLLDEYFFENYSDLPLYADTEILEYIAQELDTLPSEPSEQDLIDLGEYVGVDVMLATDLDQYDQDNQPESTSSAEPTTNPDAINTGYETGWSVDSLSPDSAEYTRADGITFIIDDYTDNAQLFYTSRLVSLSLQALALLCSLFVTYLFVKSRLNELGVVTRQSRLLADESTDPVTGAVQALQVAADNQTSVSSVRREEAERHRDLLASVAHEFRNPLARLQFANEMAMDAKADERRLLLEQSNEAAHELDALVRETLQYSRLQSSSADISLADVSLMDVFRQLAQRNLAPSASGGDAHTKNTPVEFRVDYPVEDIIVVADQRLLTRVLENLVSNALRYARSQVVLGVFENKSTPEMAVLFVQDDGPGIGVTHHERLFEPFYRVEPSRSRSTGGFGLGLSIVKSICDRHDAVVRIESNDTDGTRFIITWPCRSLDAVD